MVGIVVSIYLNDKKAADTIQVCKYDKFPIHLFNELIAAEFAKIFKIKTPEIALIKVKPEHINLTKFPQLNLGWFEKECFGSLHLKNSKRLVIHNDRF